MRKTKIYLIIWTNILAWFLANKIKNYEDAYVVVSVLLTVSMGSLVCILFIFKKIR